MAITSWNCLWIGEQLLFFGIDDLSYRVSTG